MKQQTMKCAPRHLRWQGRLIWLPAAIFFLVLSAQAQDRSIPSVGGPGGGEFVARCPPGKLLGGVELRTGDDVDAIRPLCRTPSVSVEKVLIRAHQDLVGEDDRGYGVYKYVPEHYESRTTYGVNGDATADTDWYGGSGGGIKFLVCPSANPIVSGIYVEAGGEDTVVVNRITLLCEGLTYGAPTKFRDEDFWSEVTPTRRTLEAPNFKSPSNGDRPRESRGKSVCPVSRDSRATLAVGIHGRSGVWLDAVGLICDEPKLPPEPAKLGRVKVDGPTDAPTGPPRPICEVAREARARNSPAAAGLEAQCRAAGAAGERPPAKLGRVKVDEVDAPAGPLRPICEVAREARARNSPAAAGLEAQCRAAGAAGEVSVDLNDLAARGEGIANQDPLAVELRNRQPEGPARRGFDIGMTAAEGQTAPGPAKQRIHDSLSPEEQGGFDTAEAFSLERNRNAELAAKGATIAAADLVVAEARTAETDVFYWLGFDIATGIFGDPALGALGNTSTGPGSLKIRDALSAAGQRGFNASVKLHLSRNYKP